MIPIIYDLAEAARILGFSESYLRSKLRDRTFAGMKRAGRWAMTEAQIEAAIESMCIDARPPDTPSPSGLSKHSRYAAVTRPQRMKLPALLVRLTSVRSPTALTRRRCHPSHAPVA